MSKLRSLMLLSLLFASTLVVALNVQPARADGTIYIRADGSVDPQTAPISTVDKRTYTLTGDIVNESVVVQMNNIVFDGAGFTLQGSGSGIGIDLSSSHNVTVKNTNIRSFNEGIRLDSSSYNTILSNNITTNSLAGIFLDIFSNNNTIVGNVIANNTLGILLIIPDSSGNLFFHNSFLSNTGHNVAIGLWLEGKGSSDNYWDDGYPSGGNYWSDYNGTDVYSGPYQNETGSDGIGDTPYFTSSYVPHYIDNYPLMQPWAPFEGQTIYIRADGSIDPSGAPIHRKVDLYTLTGNITSDSDGIVIERDNMTLDGAGYTFQGEGNGTGIDLSQRTNVTVQNTRITAFHDGIVLTSSSNNTVTGNNMIANEYSGIFLLFSDYNAISSNRITDNYDGVWLVSSSNNTIHDNAATNNGGGIVLKYSPDNTFFGNTAINNYAGIYLFSSSGNWFFHNNFIGNLQQVSCSQSANVWDNGYPSGGNYWSNYDSTDSHNGPYQNITGSDSIGDTPYVIDANNTDHYPMMNPVIPEFPSAITLPLLLLLLTLAITVTSKNTFRKP